MKKIRSFIYLDNYKMYSISSQLFEGLTESILKSHSNNIKESDTQKGNFASGRLLADIIEINSTSSEKKFLHDYAYTLFEDDLLKENKILQINSSNVSEKINELKEFSFVKISNRISFNDTKIINNTISNFNQFGEAITYITNQILHKQKQDLATEILKTSKDPKEKAEANKILRDKFNAKELAKTLNLYLDENYLKHLQHVLQYGYNNQFEIQMPFEFSNEHYLFSSLINRDYLLEDEISLITKYSRETEKEFTILGIPTQTQGRKEKFSLYKKVYDNLSDNTSDSSLKEAVMNIISVLTDLEATFTGKLSYEYIIDPIAIYREL